MFIVHQSLIQGDNGKAFVRYTPILSTIQEGFPCFTGDIHFAYWEVEVGEGGHQEAIEAAKCNAALVLSKLAAMAMEKYFKQS